MKKKITIVDYGLGNIVSAQQSFLKVTKEKTLNAEVIISSSPNDVLEIIPHCSSWDKGLLNLVLKGLKIFQE